MTFALHQKDAIEFLKSLADNSIDAIVTDPPYGLKFMGKKWDCDVPSVEVWVEALRVLKPGGHVLSFGGTRTYHRLVCAIEDAGFEIRDMIEWVFGSGYPKSRNGKWGATALKPAHEPVCMARKPLDGTVEENWKKWGTGALNIDGCRIAGESTQRINTAEMGYHGGNLPNQYQTGSDTGRWPANFIHDGSDEVVALFPEAPGQQGALTGDEPSGKMGSANCYGRMDRRHEAAPRIESETNAARFFYCPKASRSDRNAGCGHLPPKPPHWSSGDHNPGSFQSEGTDKTSSNNHPTVKPTDLMRYLCRLVTPPNGTVLDFYMGSGSTGRGAVLEGFHFIGNDREAAYVEIARARIQHAVDFGDEYEPPKPKLKVPEAQSDLFGK